MYRFTTTITILALGPNLQSAYAASPEDPPSRTVQFADLDLSHTAGAAVLYHRLKAAAGTLCAPLDDRGALARHMRFKACVQSAIGSAVAEVDRPALTAYYKVQTGDHNSPVHIAQNRVR